MKTSEALKKLRKGFGMPEEGDFEPKIFLLQLGAQMLQNTKVMKGYLATATENDKKMAEALGQLDSIKGMSEQMGKMSDIYAELKTAISERRIEKVEVEHIREVPIQMEPIKIDLAHTADLPEEQKAWWQTNLFEYIKAPFDGLVSFFTDALSRVQKPEEAIAVRLVDQSGERFYNAQLSVVTSGGGGGGGGTTDVSALVQELTFTGRVGEVQASPTANTILGRLKALQDNTDGLEGLVDGLEASVDGLEGFVDGLETLMTTIQGLVDGLETDLTAIKTAVQIMDDWDNGSDAAKVDIQNATLEKTNGATAGTLGFLFGGKYENSPSNIADGQYGLLRLSIDRLLMVASQGTVAHDGADSGNPVKIGYKARTTNPAAVADADRADAMGDDLGRAVVIKDQVRDLVTDGQITITNSTAETTLLAAGASGVFHDLKKLVLTNASATAVTVTLKESTGGTTRAILDLGALGSNSFVPLDFDVPMKQGTAAQNWTLTLSSNVVTVHAYVQAVKNV